MRKEVPKRRLADIDHCKKMILMAMDIAGVTYITKEELATCLDMCPSVTLVDVSNFVKRRKKK